jgi:hypothetical protein
VSPPAAYGYCVWVLTWANFIMNNS